MTATMQRPVDETYAECERLIKSTVNSFQRRYGGDRDELMSAAGEAFMEAYSGPKKRFTLSKKKRPGNFHFGGWLNKTIWYALLDTLNERHSHHFQPFSLFKALGKPGSRYVYHRLQAFGYLFRVLAHVLRQF